MMSAFDLHESTELGEERTDFGRLRHAFLGVEWLTD